MAKKKKNQTPTIENRKARFKFQILETYEAGMSLLGAEVKSIRQGQISLQEGYVKISNGNVFLHGAHISPFEHMSSHQQPDPVRNIQLLLHRKEIRKLAVNTDQNGLTLVPLKVYFKCGKAKLLLGVAKGKKMFDKRQDLKKKSIEKNLRKKYNI